jgi:hypothetical protein
MRDFVSAVSATPIIIFAMSLGIAPSDLLSVQTLKKKTKNK